MADECYITHAEAQTAVHWVGGVVVMIAIVMFIRRAWGPLVVVAIAIVARPYVIPLLVRLYNGDAGTPPLGEMATENAQSLLAWLSAKVQA